MRQDLQLPPGVMDHHVGEDYGERIIPGIVTGLGFNDFTLPYSDHRIDSHYTPAEIERELLDRKQAYMEFHERVLKGIETYYGFQTTPQEQARMRARGQSPLVMNYYRDSVRALIRFYSARMPQYDVTPLESGDERIANMLSFLLRRAWLLSKGKMQWRRAIFWMVNCGLSFLTWGWHHQLDGGKGDLVFQHWPTQYCLPDPHSQDPLYDDTDLWILYKYVTWRDAARQWPYLKEELKRCVAQPDSRRVQYGNDNRPIFSYVTTKHETFIRLSQPFMRTTAPVHIVKTKNTQMEYIDDPSMQPGFREMLQRGDIQYRIEERTVWQTAIFAGTALELVPWSVLYTQYAPVIPLIYEDVGGYDETSAIQPYGEAFHVDEIQKALNKSISTVIAHAQQVTQPRMTYRASSIPEIRGLRMAQTRDKLAAPGTAIAHTGEEPKFHPPGPLNEATFHIYKDLAGFIRETHGAHVYLSQKKDMAQTLGGFMAQVEHAREKSSDTTDVIETVMSRLGVVGIALFQQYYRSGERIARLFDDSERKRIQRLQQAAQNPEQVEQLKTLLADQQSMLYSAMSLVSDLSAGRYDCEVITNSYAPTQRWAIYNMVIEAFKLGAVDAKMVRDYLPIEDRDEVEARLSMINQLNSQLQATERDLQQKNILLRQMMLKLIQANVQINTAKDAAARKIATNNFQNTLDSMAQQFEFELELAKAEGKTEVETP